MLYIREYIRIRNFSSAI